MDIKKNAAEKAVEYVEDGMLVGLGTGSTSSWAIKALGEKVKDGLQITAVASSAASEALAKQCGITIRDFSGLSHIDLYIDGADEVDRQQNLIKGGGGALLREKILAYNSHRFLVIVDESKLVDKLGKFPLPVEIVPFAAELTLNQLRKLGAEATIRQKDGRHLITDNNNLIADCSFNLIDDPESLNVQLQLIPGVVDNGLFLYEHVSQVITGYTDGTAKVLPQE